jgi:hypothetical protein
MAFDGPVVTAGTAMGEVMLTLPQVLDEGGHCVVVRARLGGRGIEPAAQDGHGRNDSPSAGRRVTGT